MNFLAGICGYDADPMRWSETWIGKSTTIESFLASVVRILDDLEERRPGHSFCFTMVNLNVNRNGAIVAEITNQGH